MNLDPDRVFRTIWRANAVLILLVALGAFLGGSYAAIQIVREGNRPRQIQGVVNLASDDVDEEQFRLRRFEALPGTGHLRAGLESLQDYALASGGFKSSRAVRNFLFYDLETRESRWLVDGQDGLFPREEVLTRGRRDDEQVAVAILYQWVTEDTDGDGKLGSDDHSSIAISDPSGRRFEVLLEGVENVQGHHYDGGDEALVFYLNAEELHVAGVDIRSRELVFDERLAGLSPTARKGAAE